MWHAYSTNDALPYDIKVNDIVTLSFDFDLEAKNSFFDFVASGGIL